MPYCPSAVKIVAIYCFVREPSGPKRGTYRHDFFLRGKPNMCRMMVRIKIKSQSTISSTWDPTMFSLEPDPFPSNHSFVRSTTVTSNTSLPHGMYNLKPTKSECDDEPILTTSVATLQRTPESLQVSLKSGQSISTLQGHRQSFHNIDPFYVYVDKKNQTNGRLVVNACSSGVASTNIGKVAIPPPPQMLSIGKTAPTTQAKREKMLLSRTPLSVAFQNMDTIQVRLDNFLSESLSLSSLMLDHGNGAANIL